MPTDQANPRVLQHIVFGYTLDFFPGGLILGCHQLKQMLKRAGFDVKVSCAPLSNLPDKVDLLFVPTELTQAASLAAPTSRVTSLARFVNDPAYDQLLRELETGTTWHAARLADRSAEERTELVSYRGYDRIE